MLSVCLTNFLPICPRHPGYDGKSPNGWQRTSSTGLFAPSHGSHVTALIACGCDWTGVSLSPLPVIALLGAAQKS